VRSCSRIILAVIFGVVTFTCAAGDLRPVRPDERKQVTLASAPADETASSADVERAIREAGDYLIRHCRSSGRFVYRSYLDGREADAKYNLLRHAGSIYALTQYYDQTKSEDALGTVIRASRWLCAEFVGPVDARDGLLAVWTRPERLGHKKPWGTAQAKLGGAGLALLALQRVESRAPGTVPAATLSGLARFIEFMQFEDGRFCSKYLPGTGRADSWVSLYYPGEAILALLTYCRQSRDSRWFEIAARGMGHLCRTRIVDGEVPPDHWALLATEPLLASSGEAVATPVKRDGFLDHARRICRLMLATQNHDPAKPALLGGFTNDGRTCPTAIRLEGLLAAYRYLPETDVELRSRIASACHLGTGFLLRAQVRKGGLRGGFPRAVCAKTDIPENRSFNSRVPEIRIDYVQHALSALIGYRQTFLEERDTAMPARTETETARSADAVK